MKQTISAARLSLLLFVVAASNAQGRNGNTLRRFSPENCTAVQSFDLGRVYTYSYVGTIESRNNGTETNTLNGIQMRCDEVMIKVPKSCVGAMYLSKCNVYEGSSADGGMDYLTPLTEHGSAKAFAKYFKYPVYFQFNHGEVGKILFQNEEPADVRNVKRAILSSLQMKFDKSGIRSSVGDSSEVPEINVYGSGKVNRTVTNFKDGYAQSVHMERNVTNFTLPWDRKQWESTHVTETSLTPLDILTSWAVEKATQQAPVRQFCDVTLERGRHVTAVECTETHNVFNFTNSDLKMLADTFMGEGAMMTTTIHINVTQLSDERMSGRSKLTRIERAHIEENYEEESIMFDEQWQESADAMFTVFDPEHAINEIMTNSTNKFVAGLATKLARFLAHKRETEIVQLWTSVSSKYSGANLEKLKLLWVDLLEVCSSSGNLCYLPNCRPSVDCHNALQSFISVTGMSNWSPTLERAVMTALERIPQPSLGIVRSAMSICEAKTNVTSVLMLGKVVAKHVSTSNVMAAESPVVSSALAFLRQLLNGDCSLLSSTTASKYEPIMLAAIKSISALYEEGDFAVDSLLACARNPRSSSPISLAVVQALQAIVFEDNTQIRSELLSIYEDKSRPTDVRIASYLFVMAKEPTSSEANRIVKVAMQEEHNHPLTFYVREHLRSQMLLRGTSYCRFSHELTEVIRQALETCVWDIGVDLKIPSNIIEEETYNVTKTLFVPIINNNTTFHVQASLLKKRGSLIPLLANITATAEMFGKNITVIELSVDLSHLLSVLQPLFGSEGFLPEHGLAHLLRIPVAQLISAATSQSLPTSEQQGFDTLQQEASLAYSILKMNSSSPIELKILSMSISPSELMKMPYLRSFTLRDLIDMVAVLEKGVEYKATEMNLPVVLNFASPTMLGIPNVVTAELSLFHQLDFEVVAEIRKIFMTGKGLLRIRSNAVAQIENRMSSHVQMPGGASSGSGYQTILSHNGNVQAEMLVASRNIQVKLSTSPGEVIDLLTIETNEFMVVNGEARFVPRSFACEGICLFGDCSNGNGLLLRNCSSPSPVYGVSIKTDAVTSYDAMLAWGDLQAIVDHKPEPCTGLQLNFSSMAIALKHIPSAHEIRAEITFSSQSTWVVGANSFVMKNPTDQVQDVFLSFNVTESNGQPIVKNFLRFSKVEEPEPFLQHLFESFYLDETIHQPKYKISGAMKNPLMKELVVNGSLTTRQNQRGGYNASVLITRPSEPARDFLGFNITTAALVDKTRNFTGFTTLATLFAMQLSPWSSVNMNLTTVNSTFGDFHYVCAVNATRRNTSQDDYFNGSFDMKERNHTLQYNTTLTTNKVHVQLDSLSENTTFVDAVLRVFFVKNNTFPLRNQSMFLDNGRINMSSSSVDIHNYNASICLSKTNASGNVMNISLNSAVTNGSATLNLTKISAYNASFSFNKLNCSMCYDLSIHLPMISLETSYNETKNVSYYQSFNMQMKPYVLKLVNFSSLSTNFAMMAVDGKMINFGYHVNVSSEPGRKYAQAGYLFGNKEFAVSLGMKMNSTAYVNVTCLRCLPGFISDSNTTLAAIYNETRSLGNVIRYLEFAGLHSKAKYDMYMMNMTLSMIVDNSNILTSLFGNASLNNTHENGLNYFTQMNITDMYLASINITKGSGKLFVYNTSLYLAHPSWQPVNLHANVYESEVHSSGCSHGSCSNLTLNVFKMNAPCLVNCSSENLFSANALHTKKLSSISLNCPETATTSCNVTLGLDHNNLNFFIQSNVTHPVLRHYMGLETNLMSPIKNMYLNASLNITDISSNNILITNGGLKFLSMTGNTTLMLPVNALQYSWNHTTMQSLQNTIVFTKIGWDITNSLEMLFYNGTSNQTVTSHIQDLPEHHFVEAFMFNLTRADESLILHKVDQINTSAMNKVSTNLTALVNMYPFTTYTLVPCDNCLGNVTAQLIFNQTNANQNITSIHVGMLDNMKAVLNYTTGFVGEKNVTDGLFNITFSPVVTTPCTKPWMWALFFNSSRIGNGDIYARYNLTDTIRSEWINSTNNLILTSLKEEMNISMNSSYSISHASFARPLNALLNATFSTAAYQLNVNASLNSTDAFRHVIVVKNNTVVTILSNASEIHVPLFGERCSWYCVVNRTNANSYNIVTRGSIGPEHMMEYYIYNGTNQPEHPFYMQSCTNDSVLYGVHLNITRYQSYMLLRMIDQYQLKDSQLQRINSSAQLKTNMDPFVSDYPQVWKMYYPKQYQCAYCIGEIDTTVMTEMLDDRLTRYSLRSLLPNYGLFVMNYTAGSSPSNILLINGTTIFALHRPSYLGKAAVMIFNTTLDWGQGSYPNFVIFSNVTSEKLNHSSTVTYGEDSPVLHINASNILHSNLFSSSISHIADFQFHPNGSWVLDCSANISDDFVNQIRIKNGSIVMLHSEAKPTYVPIYSDHVSWRLIVAPRNYSMKAMLGSAANLELRLYNGSNAHDLVQGMLLNLTNHQRHFITHSVAQHDGLTSTLKYLNISFSVDAYPFVRGDPLATAINTLIPSYPTCFLCVGPLDVSAYINQTAENTWHLNLGGNLSDTVRAVLNHNLTTSSIAENVSSEAMLSVQLYPFQYVSPPTLQYTHNVTYFNETDELAFSADILTTGMKCNNVHANLTLNKVANATLNTSLLLDTSLLSIVSNLTLSEQETSGYVRIPSDANMTAVLDVSVNMTANRTYIENATMVFRNNFLSVTNSSIAYTNITSASFNINFTSGMLANPESAVGIVGNASLSDSGYSLMLEDVTANLLRWNHTFKNQTLESSEFSYDELMLNMSIIQIAFIYNHTLIHTNVSLSINATHPITMDLAPLVNISYINMTEAGEITVFNISVAMWTRQIYNETPSYKINLLRDAMADGNHSFTFYWRTASGNVSELRSSLSNECRTRAVYGPLAICIPKYANVSTTMDLPYMKLNHSLMWNETFLVLESNNCSLGVTFPDNTYIPFYSVSSKDIFEWITPSTLQLNSLNMSIATQYPVMTTMNLTIHSIESLPGRQFQLLWTSENGRPIIATSANMTVMSCMESILCIPTSVNLTNITAHFPASEILKLIPVFTHAIKTPFMVDLVNSSMSWHAAVADNDVVVNGSFNFTSVTGEQLLNGVYDIAKRSSAFSLLLQANDISMFCNLMSNSTMNLHYSLTSPWLLYEKNVTANSLFGIERFALKLLYSENQGYPLSTDVRFGYLSLPNKFAVNFTTPSTYLTPPANMSINFEQNSTNYTDFMWKITTNKSSSFLRNLQFNFTKDEYNQLLANISFNSSDQFTSILLHPGKSLIPAKVEVRSANNSRILRFDRNMTSIGNMVVNMTLTRNFSDIFKCNMTTVYPDSAAVRFTCTKVQKNNTEAVIATFSAPTSIKQFMMNVLNRSFAYVTSTHPEHQLQKMLTNEDEEAFYEIYDSITGAIHNFSSPFYNFASNSTFANMTRDMLKIAKSVKKVATEVMHSKQPPNAHDLIENLLDILIVATNGRGFQVPLLNMDLFQTTLNLTFEAGICGKKEIVMSLNTTSHKWNLLNMQIASNVTVATPDVLEWSLTQRNVYFWSIMQMNMTSYLIPNLLEVGLTGGNRGITIEFFNETLSEAGNVAMLTFNYTSDSRYFCNITRNTSFILSVDCHRMNGTETVNVSYFNTSCWQGDWHNMILKSIVVFREVYVAALSPETFQNDLKAAFNIEDKQSLEAISAKCTRLSQKIVQHFRQYYFNNTEERSSFNNITDINGRLVEAAVLNLNTSKIDIENATEAVDVIRSLLRNVTDDLDALKQLLNKTITMLEPSLGNALQSIFTYIERINASHILRSEAIDLIQSIYKTTYSINKLMYNPGSLRNLIMRMCNSSSLLDSIAMTIQPESLFFNTFPASSSNQILSYNGELYEIPHIDPELGCAHMLLTDPINHQFSVFMNGSSIVIVLPSVTIGINQHHASWEITPDGERSDIEFPFFAPDVTCLKNKRELTCTTPTAQFMFTENSENRKMAASVVVRKNAVEYVTGVLGTYTSVYDVANATLLPNASVAKDALQLMNAFEMTGNVACQINAMPREIQRNHTQRREMCRRAFNSSALATAERFPRRAATFLAACYNGTEEKACMYSNAFAHEMTLRGFPASSSCQCMMSGAEQRSEIESAEIYLLISLSQNTSASLSPKQTVKRLIRKLGAEFQAKDIGAASFGIVTYGGDGALLDPMITTIDGSATSSDVNAAINAIKAIEFTGPDYTATSSLRALQFVAKEMRSAPQGVAKALVMIAPENKLENLGNVGASQVTNDLINDATTVFLMSSMTDSKCIESNLSVVKQSGGSCFDIVTSASVPASKIAEEVVSSVNSKIGSSYKCSCDVINPYTGEVRSMCQEITI